jgi:hypothetical protein
MVRLSVPEAEALDHKALNLFFFFFFCGTEAWTQGLHLKLLKQTFFVMGFFKIESESYLPGLASNHDPPTLPPESS